MRNKTLIARFFLVSLVLVSNLNLFGQCTGPCPANGTDSGVGVALSAFFINPDGSTGPAIGSSRVGTCQKIRLRMAISYVTTGPSGGPSVAFSGGHMVIR